MDKIKAIVLDVDGVLTDGSFWWDSDGGESKKFSFRDVMGVSLGMKAGLLIALVSGEDNSILDRFAKKMGIADLYRGCKDKAAALKNFAEKHKLALTQVCFMGDDINDVAALEIAGLAVTPANAHESARIKAKLVMKHDGGNGAVRELVDMILSENTVETSQ